MAKTIGYMITWTTYGTWLQGDKRGYVKDGTIYPANPSLAVCSNHVHIVVDYVSTPIGLIVMGYKNCAQYALRKAGVTGRIWTKGFDKRYCFDQQSLKKRIDYVDSHDKYI